MKEEVEAAVTFLSRLVRRDLDSGQRTRFAEKLTDALSKRFENHWYSEEPCKGQAYRCIRINEFRPVDSVLDRAARESGLKFHELGLPQELTLWVDPAEVSCRFGETKGTYGTVANFRGANRENNAATLDIAELLQRHKRLKTIEAKKILYGYNRRHPTTRAYTNTNTNTYTNNTNNYTNNTNTYINNTNNYTNNTNTYTNNTNTYTNNTNIHNTYTDNTNIYTNTNAYINNSTNTNTYTYANNTNTNTNTYSTTAPQSFSCHGITTTTSTDTSNTIGTTISTSTSSSTSISTSDAASKTADKFNAWSLSNESSWRGKSLNGHLVSKKAKYSWLAAEMMVAS